MIQERYTKHLFNTKLINHPTYIQDKLKNLNEDQFGYNAFGLKDTVKLNYLEFPRELKKKYF